MIVTVFAPVRTYLSVEKEWKTHHGRKNEALPDFRRRFSQFLLSWCIRKYALEWRQIFASFTWRSVFRPIRKLLRAQHNVKHRISINGQIQGFIGIFNWHEHGRRCMEWKGFLHYWNGRSFQKSLRKWNKSRIRNLRLYFHETIST